MNSTSSLQERLQKRRGEWPSIARSASLSYWWVIKVGQGKIGEPGMTKAQRLITELDRRDGEALSGRAI